MKKLAVNTQGKSFLIAPITFMLGRKSPHINKRKMYTPYKLDFRFFRN